MKKSLLILFFLGLFCFSCKKEEPEPCTGEICVATTLNSGVGERLVGRWRFYKIAWFYETWGGGSIMTYKDTIELGNSYEIEIHENGTIDYYRNDSFVVTKKLQVDYDSFWQNNPEGHLGGLSGYLNCKTEIPEEDDFGCVLRYIDTISVRYHPFSYSNPNTGEHTGVGFYYRIPE